MSNTRFFGRRSVRVFLVLTSLIVLAVVLVPALVPAEKWKQIAFEKLHEQTGLVAQASDAKVSLIPLGLQMSDLRITDPLERPEYAGMDLAMRKVIVRARLGALLGGRVVVEEVRLVEPEVRLRLTESGEAASRESGKAPRVAGALALLSIENGTVHLTDEKGVQTDIRGLDNRANLTLDGGRARGALEGSFAELRLVDAEGTEQTLPPLAWKCDFEAAADGAEGTLVIRSLSAGGVSAQGSVGWTRGQALDLDATLDLSADLASAFEAFVRPGLGPDTVPDPWKAEDFALLAGGATAKVSLQGALPEGDDPLAVLDLVDLEGRFDDARLRILDRDDLVEVSGRFELAGRAMRLRDLELRGAVAQGSGGLDLPLDPARDLEGTFSLNVDTRQARALAEDWWPRLAPLAGEDVAGPQEWPRLGGRAELAFDLDLPGDFDPATGSAEAVRWTLSTPRLAALLPTLRDSIVLRGVRVRGDLKRAEVQQLHLTGPGLDANARLDLGGWPERMRVRGEVAATALDLDRLQESVVEETESASRTTFGVRSAWAAERSAPAPPPANLDVDVQIRSTRATTKGYAATDVTTRAVLAEQKLHLSDLRASMGGGSITGIVDVDWTADTPHWKTDLTAEAIGAGSLLEPIAPVLAGALNTTLSSKIQMDGVLDPDPEAALVALSGLAGIKSGPGTLQTEAVLGPKISQFLAAKAQDWKQLDFSSLTADIELDGGKVVFDRFFLRGETEVRVAGFVSLDGQCAYRLDVRLPAGVTPELGALAPVADLLRDEEHRIAFGVDVTGPAKKPKVQIDFAELEKRAAEKGKDKLEDQLDDTLRDKVDDLLGGLRKKGKG